MRSITVGAVLSCVSVLSLAACGSDDNQAKHTNEAAGTDASIAPESDVKYSDKKSYVVFGDFVSDTDSLPYLKFRDDGQVSLNDRCAVRQVRLNPKMPPAYVNGRPVGFC
jgi:hypothetical protein